MDMTSAPAVFSVQEHIHLCSLIPEYYVLVHHQSLCLTHTFKNHSVYGFTFANAKQQTQSDRMIDIGTHSILSFLHLNLPQEPPQANNNSAKFHRNRINGLGKHM